MAKISARSEKEYFSIQFSVKISQEDTSLTQTSSSIGSETEIIQSGLKLSSIIKY